MNPVYIGLGSNVGDSIQNIRTALNHMENASSLTILRVSSLYRTAPIGYEDQDWFINAAAECTTSLLPLLLLDLLQSIEQKMERSTPFKWGPRNIDLDILIFGSSIIKEPVLTIPHPLVEHRRFVLEPLAELAPGGIHPLLNKTFQGLLEELGTTQEIEKIQEKAS
jgi:2-amino-4-hydroxy-6-hydroxymethyldihydropteridine diphosphokinase